jgi:alpha-tubulin suppressor-like RCC1 family protein
VALKNDGTVWSWGSNGYGQLGDGTNTDRATPVQVSGLTNVKEIDAGAYHTVALKNDGTVWSWGSNGYGQLGDGTTEDRKAPVQVMVSPGVGLTNVKAIAAGDCHTVALKNDGTVWAWGRNNCSQLGDGTTIQRTTPVQVMASPGVGLTNVKVIAAAGYHTVTLKNDGTVWSWGYNYYGQLGDGTHTDRAVPVQVSGLTDVTAIAAGDCHTVALKNDGTVWAWGSNGNGQLGDGTTDDRNAPGQVKDLVLTSGGGGGTNTTLIIIVAVVAIAAIAGAAYFFVLRKR